MATAYQNQQAQQAINLMAQAQAQINAGNRAAADALAAQAYKSAQMASNPSVAAAVVNHANSWGPVAAGGGGGGGGGGSNPAATTAAQTDPSVIAARRNAYEAILGQFTAWGLGSLAGIIKDYAEQDYTSDAVIWKLRETAEYKARFPAMAALSAKGRGITEAAYISYEAYSAGLEQRFGLPKGMLLNNVTTLLTNEVSQDELLDRVRLAAANSITAPDDLKKQMKDYYNIDAGGLTAYYLDPNIAMPLLEQQAAVARIGVEAARQQTTASLSMAQELQGQGVTEDQAKKGFATVAAAQGFLYGKGETTDQTGLTRAVFGNEAEAQKVNRIATSRTGRFQGGGGFAGNTKGVTGLGTSST